MNFQSGCNADLYQDGRKVGAVENFRYIPGKRRIIRNCSLNGSSELIPGLKEPDEVEFVIKARVNTRPYAELKNSSGEILPIMMDRTEGDLLAGGVRVHAFVQPTPRAS